MAVHEDMRIRILDGPTTEQAPFFIIRQIAESPVAAEPCVRIEIEPVCAPGVRIGRTVRAYQIAVPVDVGDGIPQKG